jgi:hypothetical protein
LFEIFLTKGMRVRAHRLVAKKLGTYSVAGVQFKIAAVGQEVTGVVKHVRGDDPVNPTTIGVWIQPDEGGDEVVFDSNDIIEVFPRE